MNKLIGVLSAVSLGHPILQILIIGLTIIIQGETGIILSIFLLGRNRLTWPGFFLISLGAILFYETAVYLIGRKLRGTRLGAYLERRIKHHDAIERYLQNNSSPLIILSKFVIYLSLGVVFLSGWCRIDFRRFLRLRLLGALAWLLIMTGLIYSLVSALGRLGGEAVLHRLELVVLGLLVFFIVLNALVGRFLDRKILKRG